MTWVDMISMTIAAVAAVECVAGRIAPMDLRHHRPAVIAVYALAATVCILAASLVWQGAGLLVLDVVAISIAGHLVLTWEDWRHGPPVSAQRDTAVFAGQVMPSRIDSSDRQA